MKKSYIIKVLVLFAFILGNSYAQQPNAGYEVNVLSSTSTSTTLEFTVSDYSTSTVSINGVEHAAYNIAGMITLMEKGMPQLPSIRNSIVIPDNAGMNIKIEEQEFRTFVTKTVMPSKGHFTRDIDPNSVSYTFNEIYKQDKFYPENNISLDVPYVVRDLRGQTIQFNPMQYNPAKNTIKLCTRLVVKIYADQNVAVQNPFVRLKALNGVSTEFDPIYSTLFLNYGKGVHKYNPIPEPGRLLIVYASEYANKITPFYNWKVEKGIPTLLADYPAQTGSGAAALKTYIQNLYNSPEGLTYIILVGESNQIPTNSGVYESAPSDPCYVKLAGSDAYPDAYISRISPTSAANLGYILWKIMKYEKFPDAGVNAAWYLKGTGVASNEGTIPDWKYADTLRSRLMNNMHFTDVDRIYDPGATASQVTVALNNGRSVLNYIGHGSGTSWGTTGFSNSTIHALTNGYKNPFIIDVACLNGNFTSTECMEEAWLRAGDSINAKGAIAVYGSTTNASWTPPLDMQEHAMLLLTTRQRQTVGGVCFNGLMKGMDLNGGSSGEGLKMMEQFHIFGDCTTMLTFGMVQDSIAPTAVNNLATTEPASGSIKLTWTAPLDSSTGGIVSYDLRYSTSPITAGNFSSASMIMVAGGPDSTGTPKTYQLNSLNLSTPYYFAIKAKDIWGNTSVISNIATGTTLAAPVLSITPDSLHCSVNPDTTCIDSIYISNTSVNPSTLDYNIELTNSVFPEGSVTISTIPLANESDTKSSDYVKGKTEELFGQSLFGQGGPDAFGYKWIDNLSPNGPQYVWNDIAATGTEVTSWVATGTYTASDEGKAGPFNLGFNFKFYGLPYSQIWFSSNGWLSFTDIADAEMTNATIPDAGAPNGIIAPLWDDLDGKTTGKVYYKQEANRFIVQYNNWSGYSSSTGPFTFQVHLYKNGKILVYYKSVAGSLTSNTIGIENQTGTIGLQVSKNAAYLANERALQFSAQPDWLSTGITSGRLYNNNTAKVQLNINTEGLALGNYSMDLVVTSNDPVHPSVTVPIHMLVTDITPVELLGIEAVNTGSEVRLLWSTKTETNNKGFSIERKEGERWNAISFISGKGTTTETSDYTFIDKVNKTGKYTYRLTQVDFDGRVNLQKEIEVDVQNPVSYKLEQNYPNPFNPATNIKFALPEKSQVKVSVYNLLGQVVAVITDEVKDAGYYEYNWNASGLASGMYILSIEAKATVGNTYYKSTKKMSLLK